MAKTVFTTSDAGTKKLWDEKLFRDAIKESYWSRFMGSGTDTPVSVNNAFTKERGDRVRIAIRMKLSGDGVEEGQILEGNEEALTSYTCDITLHQYRHAVRDNGAMDRQRAMFSITDQSKQAIQDWMTEKLDKLAFDALGLLSTSTVTPSKVFYKDSSGDLKAGAAATAKSSLSQTNSKISLNMISALKAWAKTGGARAYVPIRPVRIKGKDYFVLLVHPDVMYDLKSDTAYQQAQREAAQRGDENPLFTGAAAIWDGVVIHEHENCGVAADGGGATVTWSQGLFFGAQALCWAWGKHPRVIQKTFDYEDQQGYGVDVICGAKKPVFNSLDYGSVGVWLARTAISSL